MQNRAILESIIKCLILCGKQNIPIRGNVQESSNFMALLSFRAETDEDHYPLGQKQMKLFVSI